MGWFDSCFAILFDFGFSGLWLLDLLDFGVDDFVLFAICTLLDFGF